ncbi:MAG TPA: hypothetical protein VKP58_02960 [Candidatus Acidoferrum sp.]|nr:hypothetical protein [Candidatus Acidoferrum sp.]
MNEKLEMNLMQPRGQSLAGKTIWLAITGITAFVCLVLAGAAGKFVGPFQEMFQAINVELPWPTRFLLASYHWTLPAFYFGLLTTIFAVQFFVRDFRTKRLYTVRVLLAAIIGAGLIVFLLYLPVLTIASKLVDTN